MEILALLPVNQNKNNTNTKKKKKNNFDFDFGAENRVLRLFNSSYSSRREFRISSMIYVNVFSHCSACVFLFFCFCYLV